MSDHYVGDKGKLYFKYQNAGALQQGDIEARKFRPFVTRSATVLDFGCGSGAVLASLDCENKVGIEINAAAQETARSYGITVYDSLDAVSMGSVDLVISNHALEHVPNPLHTLKAIKTVLKLEGQLVLYVPIDDWRTEKFFSAADINRHLYTWTPLLLGNLLDEAGFAVEDVRVITHAWPPRWQRLDRMLPVWAFDAICIGYSAWVKRRQIRAVARLKP
jgi:SAM-dependent methyltransferase